MLVVAAVVVFYAMGKQDLWLRVLSLLALMVVAVVVYFTSESGKQLIAYGKDSVKEVRKVVWPSRQEAMQMTGYVFAFMVVMALFLWLTDKTLEWVLYDLLLGWKRRGAAHERRNRQYRRKHSDGSRVGAIEY